MKAVSGSFRDPSGQVFEESGRIIRTITDIYKEHWEESKDFLSEMADEGLVVPFKEIEPVDGAWKTIEAEKLPFISYPYEWSFDQLKDAALLTLKLQKYALERGLILKDASAYNIQFVNGNPIFIDHLSFEIWEEGAPWQAYRQFCSHFIAPLALMSSIDLRCGSMSKLWIDGIPLDLAVSMLPNKKKLNPGLNFHLFAHAKMQQKYSNTDSIDSSDSDRKVKSSKITAKYLIDLAASIERLIEGKAMSLSDVTTEWGDYYNNTNYTEDAADHKYKIVSEAAARYKGKSLALDLGANDGHYTKAISPYFSNTIAADIDPLAVNNHYLAVREARASVLPLIIDFANPSSAIGFNNTERDSFINRCKTDFVIALAVIHHLRITAGIPLVEIADFFADMLNDDAMLVLEFVPKEDSQTKKILFGREDIFSDYTLEQCEEIFSKRFELEKTVPVEGTVRSILLLRKIT